MLTVCRERKSARFVCRGTDYLEIGHLTHDFVLLLFGKARCQAPISGKREGEKAGPATNRFSLFFDIL